MTDGHISEDLLTHWLDGDVDALTLLQAALPHLLGSCARCQETWRQATRDRIPGRGLFAELHHEAASTGLGRDEAIRSALDQVRVLKKDALGSVGGELAREHMAELLRLSREERVSAVAATPDTYGNPRLASLLLEEARNHLPEDPEETHHLASLAAQVVHQKPPGRSFEVLGRDLLAEACAVTGNAWRVQRRLGEAESCFQQAHRSLELGSGDPLIFAEILWYRGLLLRDQGRPHPARALWRQAASIYSKLAEDAMASRVMVHQALVENELGDPGKAVEVGRAALELIAPETDPQLHQTAIDNLALFVAGAGDPDRALEILDEAPPSPDTPPRLAPLRGWTRARVLAKAGRHPEAIALLEMALQHFGSLGDETSRATATLDLALLYEEAGDLAKARTITEEILPVLVDLRLPDAVLKAMTLLRQAA